MRTNRMNEMFWNGINFQNKDLHKIIVRECANRTSFS